MASSPSKKVTPPPIGLGTKLVLAGVSCMCGQSVANPMDVMKIRLQTQGQTAALGGKLKYPGMLSGLGIIVREEGILGLYKGLSPALLREGSYSALRMGLYEPIKELLGATDPANTPLYLKIIAGGGAGALGGAIANPADLIKVRMQGDMATPGQKPRYTGLFNAFSSIASKEGVVNGLYRGVGPTASRGMLLTAAQLPSYDHIKHTMLNMGLMADGKPLHFVSSFLAGFIAVGVTNPVDVVKTRVMNQKVDPITGKGVTYSSAIHCFTTVARTEGIAGLYKGFFPSWLRLGPHTVVTFLVMEQLRAQVGMRGI
eukprot:m.17296 g.17296  ORF g.17296 m.17296 type:complete len:314 (-) comp11425_c0_seq1:65-1006(-)